MAQGRISWGSVLVGALIGGGVAYAIVKYREQPKKTTEPKEQVPLPPAPPQNGLGTGPAHRRPLPDTQVWIPQTPQDRKALDQTICDVWSSYEEPPELEDLLFAVLDEVAPEGGWPTVPGDHASLPSLQAIIAYRLDEVSQKDKSSSVADNFDMFCIDVATPPSPMGPEGLAG